MLRFGEPVDLAFANKNVRHLCESHSRARKFLGDAVASQLRSRLADIDAAANPTELKAGDPRELTGDCGGQLALSLCDRHFLVLTAVGDKVPTTHTGTVDWGKVTRAMVLRIEKA